MDTPPTSSRRYRPELRHRRRGQNIQQSARQKEEDNHEERDRLYGASDKRSSHEQEWVKRRPAMTKDHRFFHRRQAQAVTRILTVNVEVIATVDSNGILVGQETKTENSASTPTLQPAVLGPLPAPVPAVVAPVASAVVNVVDSVAPPALPAVVPVVDPAVAPLPPALPPTPSLPRVPSVPPFPTDALPVVPSVPAFPSNLNVPAYPFSSGVPAQALQVSTGPAIPSPAATSLLGSSVPPSSLVSVSAPVPITPNPASNSTTASTRSLTPTTSLASFDSVTSVLPASVLGSIPSSRLSSSNLDEKASSRHASATSSSNVGKSTYYSGAGGLGGAPANTATPPSQGTAATGAGSTGGSTPLETPQVVGSVVGSLAGAALILAIILMLLRRHKRKRQGALQLSNEETTERAQPISQDIARNNRIPSAFLNRFSGISRSTVETNTSGGERSFQRVSGRKLPSAFSEGMTSDQFSCGGTMSGSSYYQDDYGTYGGPGISKEMGKEIGGSPVAAGSGLMNIRPSPARTPVIRHPDDDVNPFADPAPFPRDRSHLSPPQSPNPEKPHSTLGRSLQSADGSRSSKFTENV